MIQTIGMYLIFAAVLARAAAVLSGRSELPFVISLLAIYALALFAETRSMRHKSLRYITSPEAQLAYLVFQSLLVFAALILSSYEDFLAMLFVPLSLQAVFFFGRQLGYTIIGIFSLTMILTLLFSHVGELFGLAMGTLYSGICFLFGGYAHQVQKARAARGQNQRMLDQLQVAHRQLQGYADQIASLAVEQERNRLARELHDSVTQTVFSMNLAAESARLLVDRQPLRAAAQLLRIEELAASAQCEIQSLVSQLRPHSIMELGFPVVLQQIVMEHKMRDGLEVSLEIRGDGNLPETVATSLCSIAHEALVNVSKHSGTSRAILRLSLSKDHSSLEVEDHGAGFNPEVVQNQRGHFGLAGMCERAREIGWRLSIASKERQGTRILVTEDPAGGREWQG